MTWWGGGLFWSQTHRACCVLVASLPDGRLLVRHELTWKGVPEDVAARELLAFVADKRIPLRSVVAQPAIFPHGKKSYGETISHSIRSLGVPLVEGDDDRINGWSRVRSWLHARPHGGNVLPSLVIHPDCEYLLHSLPTLVADDKHPDEIVESPEAYPAHALRLYLMNRPHPWQAEKAKEPGPDTWGHVLRTFREKATSRHIVGSSLVR